VIVDAVVFLEHFKDLPDERQSAKVRYPLAEVLLLRLLAVIAGAQTITDIARFGDNKLDLLRRFRPFREARRRTIIGAISSPPWMPSNSNAVAWLLWRL
jgi:DDE_Tnp_1-associated